MRGENENKKTRFRNITRRCEGGVIVAYNIRMLYAHTYNMHKYIVWLMRRRNVRIKIITIIIIIIITYLLCIYFSDDGSEEASRFEVIKEKHRAPVVWVIRLLKCNII